MPEWVLSCEWYEDEDGFIYIVPPDGLIVDWEGPNQAIMEGLVKIYREGRTPNDLELLDLGLTRIPRQEINQESLRCSTTKRGNITMMKR